MIMIENNCFIPDTDQINQEYDRLNYIFAMQELHLKVRVVFDTSCFDEIIDLLDYVEKPFFLQGNRNSVSESDWINLFV